ncbi:MAG: hypothetical protein KatS3mg031_0442 [Chitinophagales bacterium]|nr:MAG: hypothetical protein KatS3mg031_0442 [Chitinophagales bacterium]
MIAALISQRFNPGVDVEEVRPKVQRVMHKFLSDEEMAGLVDSTDLRLLTLCWSVKESVFKVMGIPALSFREEIRLQLPLRQQDSSVRVCSATGPTFAQRCRYISHLSATTC